LTHLQIQNIIFLINNWYSFFQFIYQKFYKMSSVLDKGSLSQLRNFIERIDVQGPEQVIQKYR
jgi:hypothetical protein